MSLALLLAAQLVAQSGGISISPNGVEVSDRWEFRHCTRVSADAQLRSRPRALAYADVAEKAFADCAAQLRKVAARQGPAEVEQLKQEQTQLIKIDVEMFYWDIVANRI